jgi:hypothetical protein
MEENTVAKKIVFDPKNPWSQINVKALRSRPRKAKSGKTKRGKGGASGS